MSREELLWREGEPKEPLQALLARGGVLAIPTESSYGLGADPRNPRGVESVYAVKGRAPDKPLPVVIAGVHQLECLGVDPGLQQVRLLGSCWPAPLSVLLPTAGDLPAAAGSGSVAVRVPAHAGLRRLLEELGPLTATSANRSGDPPALTAEQAAELVEDADARVVVGPPLPGGPPSTLIRWEDTGWKVLRQGAFATGDLPGR